MKKTLQLLLIVLLYSGSAIAQNCQAYFTYQVGNTTPNGTMVSFYDTSYSQGTITSWSWTTSTGQTSTLQDPNFSFNTSGNYQVCLTITAMVQNQLCTSTWCDSIFITGGNCTSAFTSTATNQSVQLAAQQINGNYVWTFGDGTSGTGQNPIHNYAIPGNYTVCLTVTTSSGQTCSGCSTVTVGSASPCDAYFSVSPNPGTSGFTFNNQSTGNPSNFYWTFGDGSSSTDENPTHFYNGTGTYVVCLYISDSLQLCSDFYCDTLQLGSGSTCTALFTPGTPINNTVNFTNQSTGNFTNVYWTFGNGTSSTLLNPTANYSSPGTYLVCLTISDSMQTCYDMYCDTITIPGTPMCQASFYTYIDSSGAMQFVNTSTGNPTNYSWVFSNGVTSTQQNPSITFPATGWYGVCLTIWTVNGPCQSTACDSVYFSGNPTGGCQAFFTVSTTSGGNPVQFTDNSVGNPGSWLWSFGDGSTSTLQNPVHTYAQSGSYPVCLTVGTPGTVCYDTYCDTIVINALCIPVFTWVEDSLNAGTGTVIMSVSNSCGGTVIWSFGDGTAGTGNTVTHQYGSASWFMVCATVTIQGVPQTYCDSVYSNRLSAINEYGFGEVILYPNPAHDNFQVTFTTARETPVEIGLFNAMGQRVSYSGKLEFPAGANSYRFHTREYPAGMYIVQIQSGNLVTHYQVLLQ